MAAVFKTRADARPGATLDRLAICVSAACLAQCLLLPVLVVVTPLMSVGFLGEEAFHLFLLAVIVPLSILAFGLGYRLHRNRSMLVPGGMGLGLVATAAVLEATVLHGLTAAVLTSLGGVLLIAGHWLNLRQRRRVCTTPQS
ncbi:MerC domain-containing protein [Wenzhouxiangella sp. AB-CW3]|uniref:MerC domain-containing protein n=1 Tax=Wenzhouxiangella sp. AB-CW3 TaxID=2771012 RepID=UPI00168A4447|nr:MerC domain-containing protein [Wenzhouxiangella sp. AB-CW3]QOC22947.1 MerC domain-containing protein [Wenzhouxiangella sp. AB-CW3]